MFRIFHYIRMFSILLFVLCFCSFLIAIFSFWKDLFFVSLFFLIPYLLQIWFLFLKKLSFFLLSLSCYTLPFLVCLLCFFLLLSFHSSFFFLSFLLFLFFCCLQLFFKKHGNLSSLFSCLNNILFELSFFESFFKNCFSLHVFVTLFFESVSLFFVLCAQKKKTRHNLFFLSLFLLQSILIFHFLFLCLFCSCFFDLLFNKMKMYRIFFCSFLLPLPSKKTMKCFCPLVEKKKGSLFSEKWCFHSFFLHLFFLGKSFSLPFQLFSSLSLHFSKSCFSLLSLFSSVFFQKTSCFPFFSFPFFTLFS